MKKLIEEINAIKELKKWSDIELSHRLGKSDGYISSLKQRPVTTETQLKIMAELEKLKAPKPIPKVVPRPERTTPPQAQAPIIMEVQQPPSTTPLERIIFLQWILVVVLIGVLVLKSL